MTVLSTPTVRHDSPFDILLRGGTVFDGTGGPPIAADVGITGGRITGIGDLSHASALQTISASGRYVCPGFIDIHTHSDLTALSHPGMESSLAQGVTSEVFGNCGIAVGLLRTTSDFVMEQRWLQRDGIQIDWDQLSGFLQRVEDNGVAINVATLAGHGTLRKRVMGLVNRPADAKERTALQQELEAALEQGAIGLSSGLEYVPGMYADVEEMTSLAKVARNAGGFYATHLRDEGDHLVEAVAEAIAVARGAQIPLQLSHHKSEKPRNWGKVLETLAMVDAAQEEGLDILLDQYPYSAYQTGLATIALPSWAATGTPALMAERLSDPETRQKTFDAMTDVDWTAVEIANCREHREYQGRRIADLAAANGQDPRDFVLDLLATAESFVSAAHFAMSETDIEYVLRDRRVMIGSDAVALSGSGSGSEDKPHPRTYGTFARVLARYVREKQVLTWQEAIRRMTSLPARRLGWRDRGILSVGNVADIVIFNPDTITDRATFEMPHQLAAGVESVLVGGTLAFSGGVASGTRSGKVVRRTD